MSRRSSHEPVVGRVPVPDDVALSVRNLHTHFHTDSGIVKAVDGVSFDVHRGEVLAVVGESGSGKSVTGLSIMGLLPHPTGRVVEGEILWNRLGHRPDSGPLEDVEADAADEASAEGSADVDGTDDHVEDLVQTSERRYRRIRGGEISMVFQDPMTALNPVFTIGSQIVEMVRLHEKVSKAEARARAVDALAAVGIPQPEKRLKMYPHEFSGGMRQRAMIAMAIVCDPDFIIADEPTTALDVTVQSQVLEVLAEARERTGAAMILVTHDLGVVAGVADRVMVMYAGRQAEVGEIDDVFYDIRHPYTRGLLNSLPRVDASGDSRLRPIEGQPPSLLAPPPGCMFHPRCDQAEVPGRCDTEIPELVQVGPGHTAACHFAEVPVVAPYSRRRVPAATPAPGTPAPAPGAPPPTGEATVAVPPTQDRPEEGSR